MQEWRNAEGRTALLGPTGGSFVPAPAAISFLSVCYISFVGETLA